jgi:protein-tyrosine phosphatase
MHSVLFICTANICRSPMAMGLLRKIVSDEPEKWRIESAGVYARDGFPAAQNTQIVVRTRGGDVGSHRSRLVNRPLVEQFNLVLVMERNHRDALKAAFPEFGSRIRMFSEMEGLQWDILDPIGGSLDDYEHTAREIDAILHNNLETIRKLSDGN